MSTTNNGGPAFPQPAHTSQNSATGETTQYQWFSDGMTLRDYFAAHADVSIYTPIETFERANGRKPNIGELATYIANIRTVEADAMLKAMAA